MLWKGIEAYETDQVIYLMPDGATLYIFLKLFIYILTPIYFSCSGEWCNVGLLLSSRNVLWTKKLLQPFHRQEGE